MKGEIFMMSELKEYAPAEKNKAKVVQTIHNAETLFMNMPVEKSIFKLAYVTAKSDYNFHANGFVSKYTIHYSNGAKRLIYANNLGQVNRIIEFSGYGEKVYTYVWTPKGSKHMFFNPDEYDLDMSNIH